MSTKTETYTITGEHVARIAQRDGLTVNADGSVCVEWAGCWTSGDATGYRVEDYFRAGKYLGPDDDGVEPIWRDAENNINVARYLAGLSDEACADWASGRIDEVMTDHAIAALGPSAKQLIQSHLAGS